MLYLAEVKKTKGFMGSKVELLLLACERNDKSWSMLPSNPKETIEVSGDQANGFNDFNEGVLVVVNLSTNRQVQGQPDAAANKIPNILQNLSRIVDKVKSKEEEIEQWKQSLTYQSQELNRREMEMESQMEEVERVNEELAKLEQKRQEINNAKAEAEKLRADVEREKKNLEAKWDHVRSQQANLDENQSSGLSGEDSKKILDIIEFLEECQFDVAGLGDRLQNLRSQHQAQLALIETYTNELESKREAAGDRQTTLDNQEAELQERQREFQEKFQSLEQAEGQLDFNHKLLESKQESLNLINYHLQNQDEIRDLIKQISQGAASSGGETVDLSAIEKMPLGELEEVVNTLKDELEKLVQMVNAQEEELTLNGQMVKELQDKIAQADQYAKIDLETELADAQESKSFLDETLVGQRKTLKSKQGVFRQYFQVYQRRQGVIEVNAPLSVDFSPLLEQLEEQKEQKEEERRQLDSQIEKIHQGLNQVKNIVQNQAQDIRSQQQQLEEEAQQLAAAKAEVVKMWVEVGVVENMLKPIQASCQELGEKIQEVEGLLESFKVTQQQNQDAVQQLGDVVKTIA